MLPLAFPCHQFNYHILLYSSNFAMPTGQHACIVDSTALAHHPMRVALSQVLLPVGQEEARRHGRPHWHPPDRPSAGGQASRGLRRVLAADGASNSRRACSCGESQRSCGVSQHCVGLLLPRRGETQRGPRHVAAPLPEGFSAGRRGEGA